MKPTKITLPEELKRDVPHTTYGKILAATPVVMAVVATMLAGLATSEMTRAQYDRSLGAQQQSKAGDQWSFFQAKRLRGAYQRNTADLLQTLTEVRPIDITRLKTFAQPSPDLAAQTSSSNSSELLSLLDSAPAQQAIAVLQKSELPATPSAPPLAPNMKAAMDAVENAKTDAEVVTALAAVSIPDLDQAVRNARDQAQAFDNSTKPINQAIEQIE